MWEAAINYSDNFGPVTLGLYGGIILGHNDAKSVGHKGLTDWGVGTQVDWDVTDDMKWSFGGAYRKADTYAFNINNAFSSGSTTESSPQLDRDLRIMECGHGVGNGRTDGFLGAPTIGTHALLFDAAYAVNTNLQLTAGWEKLNYSRTIGTFYNGAPTIGMDAVFLHAVLNI